MFFGINQPKTPHPSSSQPNFNQTYYKPNTMSEFRASKFASKTESQFSSFKFHTKPCQSSKFLKKSYHPEENKFSLYQKKNDKILGPENTYNKSRIIILVPLIQARICKKFITKNIFFIFNNFINNFF